MGSRATITAAGHAERRFVSAALSAILESIDDAWFVLDQELASPKLGGRQQVSAFAEQSTCFWGGRIYYVHSFSGIVRRCFQIPRAGYDGSFCFS